jgi:mono/diheme cytochrome c family protein
MKINQIKIYAIAIITLPIFAIAVFNINRASAFSAPQEDAATAFKTKCAACHTPKAEKFYDPAKATEVQVETILKGRKGEKPPYMPGFEAKGMTAEQAKELADYMKQLRAPAS